MFSIVERNKPQLFQGLCADDDTVIAEVQCQCAFDYVATCDSAVGQADIDVYNEWRINQNRLRKYLTLLHLPSSSHGVQSLQ